MSDTSETWKVLQDDAKNYITLAAGLLAITATFAERLISGDTLGRVALIVAWVCLGIAIIFGAYSAGGSVAGLAAGSSDFRRVASRLDATVAFIGVGVVLLAVAAWRTTVTPSELEATNVVAAAKSVASDMSSTQDHQLSAVSVHLDRLHDWYVVMVSDTSSSTIYEITLDVNSLRLLEATVDSKP